MSVETDFRALLLAAVTSLVGSNAAGKAVYPATYPQNAPAPAVRYAKITGAPGLHMQGSDGLNFDLIQVDARAATAADVLAIRDAAVAALHAYSGTQGSTQFQLIALRDDRGEKYETNGAQQFFTLSMDFDVTWRVA